MVTDAFQDEIERVGTDWKVPPIDAITGYRTLPPFIVQPVIRAIPESAEGNGDEEDLLENSTGTPKIASAPGSPPPNTNAAPKCIHAIPSQCASVAAGRCESKACLIHCREMRALAGGMPAEEVASKSGRGELAGLGCEAHESKVRAKNDRRNQKRKHRAEAKEEGKRQKTGSKARS